MKKSNLHLVFFLALAAAALAAPALQAKPNDLTLNRLVVDEDDNPLPLGTDCSTVICEPDQTAFRNLMREFGYAIAPMKLLPGETHGFGGGSFSILGHVTFISNGENYWKNGVQEQSPPKSLFLFQASSQFIFIPYFLEWGFTIGYLFTTSDTTIGFNVKTSPFEGFRKKALGALPDITFGFGLNRLIGDDEISLTTGTASVAISYSFAPGGVIVLTPFVDLSFVGVVAESELVDPSPQINQFNPTGNPSGPACPIHSGTQSGSVHCVADISDYNINLKFTREWIYFAKMTYGIRLIYELLSISVAGSHGHQFSGKVGDASNVLGQISFSAGLDF